PRSQENKRKCGVGLIADCRPIDLDQDRTAELVGYWRARPCHFPASHKTEPLSWRTRLLLKKP
ncbi:MAG: hypothetical protein Q8M24_26020, partial [Pseudolabrys sp.]|nr:hypothetical protein [Pseudolabrys sp.]